MNNEERKEKLIEMLKDKKTNKEIIEFGLFNTCSGMNSFCNRNKISLSEIRTGKRTQIKEFNDNFMEDLEFKYYFAGLIASDGTIDIKGRNRIRLCLKDTDREILDKLAKHIFKNEHILYESSKTLKDGVSKSTYLELHVSNVDIVNFMLSMGITNAKTKTMNLKFDNLSEQNIVDFMRGYFDGDGCVTLLSSGGSVKKYLRSSYIGNEDTMHKMSNILNTVNIKHTLRDITSDKYTFPFFEIRIHSIEDNIKFFDYLYSHNPKFFLERKFSKFNNYINK